MSVLTTVLSEPQRTWLLSFIIEVEEKVDALTTEQWFNYGALALGLLVITGCLVLLAVDLGRRRDRE
jgi:hypothetical protein